MNEAMITLASGSAIRAQILEGACVPFRIVKPGVDEGAIKKEALAAGVSLDEMAVMLAEAKCMAVAKNTSGLVIGSDQIMEFEGRAYDKPVDMAEAKDRLMMLQGKTHALVNGVAVARDGNIIWRNLERSKLTMRAMTENEIDLYLQAAGPKILTSVGAYQIENIGGRLFEKVEGNHFAILGMSLFPLLNLLRQEEAIAF